jgi:hypothetical protein
MDSFEGEARSMARERVHYPDEKASVCGRRISRALTTWRSPAFAAQPHSDARWKWLFKRSPVALELVPTRFKPDASRSTTVVNWTAYGATEYEGVRYG